MAFAYTVKGRSVIGDRWMVYGTFASSDSGTGGDIVTGLKKVEFVSLQHTGAAVIASAPSVNETLPLESGTVTIVTVANTAGVWMATGLQ